MNAEERRRLIMQSLSQASAPVSASALAARFGVSRQIIVGDVALLRAAGEDIAAFPRGYMLSHPPAGNLKTIACCHSPEQTEEELNIIVDNGCTVKDVIVEHPIYGQLTGMLELHSRYDVQQFIQRSEKESASPLSTLTGGIHLHTLVCPDENAFQRVKDELGKKGFLLV